MDDVERPYFLPSSPVGSSLTLLCLFVPCVACSFLLLFRIAASAASKQQHEKKKKQKQNYDDYY